MEYLIILVGGIIGFLIRDYFPGYIRKKGENLATKEDIEEITKKIESVKTEINFKKDLERQLLDTKQRLLMEFYDEITSFYYESLAVNFGDFPMDSGKCLFEYQNAFYKSVAGIMKSFQRLVIFLPSETKLMKIARDLTQSTIEARKVLKNHFTDIKITTLQEQDAHLKGDREELERMVRIADEANSNFWNKMRPEVESFRSSLQNYIQEMNTYVSLKNNGT